MTVENRIDEEELDWDEDVSTFDGKPYSGAAYLKYPDGSLKREVTFENGFEEGICREWHPNGKLKCQWDAKRGRAEGEMKEWYDTGQLKSVGVYEYGAELQYAEWNKSGEIIEKRHLDDTSPIAKYVEQMRKANS